jgi:hypothetical protein
MKPLRAAAAAVEAVTGLVLLVYPVILVRLLFGAEIADGGAVISRIAGVSLIALGVACWPDGVVRRALNGLLTYNALLTPYLIYLGVDGEWVGPLLWPVVAAHMVLTFLLAWAWINAQKTLERSITDSP